MRFIRYLEWHNLEFKLPQNSPKTQKPTGLSFSNPQNGLRFAMQESTEMNACAAIGSIPCLTSATLHKQSILCLLSYDAQRLYALWIPKP